MSFFDTHKPYEIANEITCNHELATDLVAFVFIMMSKRDDIKDEKGYFARCAYQQWNWSNSEFNRANRFNDVEYQELEQEEVENEETERQRILRDYIEEPAKDVYEWFAKGIARLRIQGMTYKQIETEVGIGNYIAQQAIKKFNNDFRDYFNKRIGGVDNNNLEDA